MIKLKSLILEAYYDDIPEDDRVDLASQYFAIGHDGEDGDQPNDNWCWMWDGNTVLAKKGGTHAINFGSDAKEGKFSGWYDVHKNIISINFPDRELQKIGNRRPTEDDIPNYLHRKLLSKFGNRSPKFFVVENLKETVESPTSFLRNPSQNSRTFGEVLDDFESKGGKLLGAGSSGFVMYHPAWKYVIKVFSDDAPYLQFVRFVIQNPRPSFPKFYDKPRRILPNYKRTRKNEYIYIVKMEKLNPISKEEFLAIDFYRYYGNTDFNTVPQNHVWAETKKKIDLLNQEYPKLKTFLEDYNILIRSKIQGSLDITQPNIMKRNEGEFILADPFWAGETPYQTYDRLQKIEMDYYGGDEYVKPEPEIQGGQRYKNPQKPKPIKYKDTGDKSPF